MAFPTEIELWKVVSGQSQIPQISETSTFGEPQQDLREICTQKMLN